MTSSKYVNVVALFTESFSRTSRFKRAYIQQIHIMPWREHPSKIQFRKKRQIAQLTIPFTMRHIMTIPCAFFFVYEHIEWLLSWHYSDAIISAMASQIISLTIVYSIIYSGEDQEKTSKLRVTGLCAGNSPENAENVSIWWRHHERICVETAPWIKSISSRSFLYSFIEMH